jgi:hypothetical protein
MEVARRTSTDTRFQVLFENMHFYWGKVVRPEGLAAITLDFNLGIKPAFGVSPGWFCEPKRILRPCHRSARFLGHFPGQDVRF